MVLEGTPYGFDLALTQQAIVHEDARDLRPDGSQQQRRGHRRIDAAGQAADDAVLADPFPQGLDRLLQKRTDLPQAVAAADRPTAVADGGDRAGLRRGQRDEIALDRLHLIAVTHPDGRLARHVGEQAVGVMDVTQGPAELAAGGRQHLAAEQMTGQVQTVANAQYGYAEVEDFGIAQGSAGSVDAGGAAGEDQAARLQ